MKARLPQEYSNKGPGNMQSMLKQVQKCRKIWRWQAELDEREHSASSGGGAVTATVDGNIRYKLDIKPEVVDPEDVEMLADLIGGS